MDKYKRTKKEIRQTLEDLKWILQTGDERELMEVLRKYGIRDEDPRFAELVQLFRALRAGKT
jgi:hypothetical protein